MKNSIARVAASTVMTAGLGLAGLGVAAIAQAQPAPFPDYHWCPGEGWDPGWGPNWEGGSCRDEFHRGADGLDHSRDWRGPGWDRDHPGGPAGGPGWQR